MCNICFLNFDIFFFLNFFKDKSKAPEKKRVTEGKKTAQIKKT